LIRTTLLKSAGLCEALCMIISISVMWHISVCKLLKVLDVAMQLYMQVCTYLSLILISCIICREVICSTQKEGEITARLKQMEVALDAAEMGKQNAEAEAALAKEKAEVLMSEIKRTELMVSV